MRIKDRVDFNFAGSKLRGGIVIEKYTRGGTNMFLIQLGDTKYPVEESKAFKCTEEVVIIEEKRVDKEIIIMPEKKKLEGEELEKIRALHKAGATYASIAREYGVYYDTIKRVVNRVGKFRETEVN